MVPVHLSLPMSPRVSLGGRGHAQARIPWGVVVVVEREVVHLDGYKLKAGRQAVVETCCCFGEREGSNGSYIAGHHRGGGAQGEPEPEPAVPGDPRQSHAKF